MQIMVFVVSPEDFISWTPEAKVVRYKRILEWHDFISNLSSAGILLNAWGTRQLTSRSRLVRGVDKRVLVYEVASLDQFDRIMTEDPLRDLSRYQTIVLKPLSKDREEDLKRPEILKSMLMSNHPEMEQRYNTARANFYRAPEYSGAITFSDPPSPRTDLTSSLPTDTLEFLVLSTNPAEFVTQWDDIRKTIHAESVAHWHYYVSKMIQEGKVTHAWAAHDFLDRDNLTEHAKGKGVAVYRVHNFEEFDDAFGQDPIRDASSMNTVALKSIVDQKDLDIVALKLASERL